MSQQQETFILYGLMALAVIATIQIILTCGQCCLTSWVYKKGVKSTVQKKSPSPSEQRPKKAARKSQGETNFVVYTENGTWSVSRFG